MQAAVLCMGNGITITFPYGNHSTLYKTFGVRCLGLIYAFYPFIYEYT